MANAPGQGRRPDPKALQLLKGVDGKDPNRINHDEPEHDNLSVAAPSWLGKVATAEWNRLAPSLSRTGILTTADKMALEAYCECYALFRKASKEIDKFADNPKDSSLDQNDRNWINIRNGAMKELRSWASLFGLSPSDRTRIVSPNSAGKKAERMFD